MKRLIAAALAAIISAAMLISCAGCSEYSPASQYVNKPYFEAVILEINGNTILAECTASPDNTMTAGSQVSFSADGVQLTGITGNLMAGRKIKVYYDGMVMETYPLQLGEVYAIEQLSE